MLSVVIEMVSVNRLMIYHVMCGYRDGMCESLDQYSAVIDFSHDVYKRQIILTTTVPPRTVKLKIYLMAVDT